MATVHREPNQVKWIGVRPGHKGEEIIKNIDLAASAIVYTVPADKLLLLFDWSIGIIQNVNNGSRLQLRTAVPVVYAELFYVTSGINTAGQVASQSLNIPIEIPATYDIYVTCAVVTRGYIHGILIDA